MDSLNLQCVIDPGMPKVPNYSSILNKKASQSLAQTRDADAFLAALDSGSASEVEEWVPEIAKIAKWKSNPTGMMNIAKNELAKMAQISVQDLPEQFVVWADSSSMFPGSGITVDVSTTFTDELTPFLARREDVLADLGQIAKSPDAGRPLFFKSDVLQRLDQPSQKWIQDYIASGGKVETKAFAPEIQAAKPVIKTGIDLSKGVEKVVTDVPRMVPGTNYSSGFTRHTSWRTPDGKTFTTKMQASAHLQELKDAAVAELPAGEVQAANLDFMTEAEGRVRRGDAFRFLDRNPDGTPTTKDIVEAKIQTNRLVSNDALARFYDPKTFQLPESFNSLAKDLDNKVRLNLERELANAKSTLEAMAGTPAGGPEGYTAGVVRRLEAKLAEVPRFAHDGAWYVEERTKNIISSWASTSADDNPFSIAVQIQAAETFPGMDAGLGLLRERVSDRVLNEAYAILKDEGHVIDGILRSMYDVTQERFKAMGIKEIEVYRGYSMAQLPPWLADMRPAQVTFEDWIDAQLKHSVFSAEDAAAVKSGDLDIMDLIEPDSIAGTPPGSEGFAKLPSGQFQPLSSFSASYTTATDFAAGLMTGDGGGAFGVVVGVRVPISNIFSTPFSGSGCLNEAEFLTMGNIQGEASVQIWDLTWLKEVGG